MNRIDCIGYDPIDCERYDCSECVWYDEENDEREEEKKYGS